MAIPQKKHNTDKFSINILRKTHPLWAFTRMTWQRRSIAFITRTNFPGRAQRTSRYTCTSKLPFVLSFELAPRLLLLYSLLWGGNKFLTLHSFCRVTCRVAAPARCCQFDTSLSVLGIPRRFSIYSSTYIFAFRSLSSRGWVFSHRRRRRFPTLLHSAQKTGQLDCRQARWI
jgi:hypothetical protein